MGTLLLVRHSQASAFEDNFDRLSTLGEKQARLLGESWRKRGVQFERVFAGPRVRNPAVSEFVFSGERFSLASFNETPHLSDAALVTVR